MSHPKMHELSNLKSTRFLRSSAALVTAAAWAAACSGDPASPTPGSTGGSVGVASGGAPPASGGQAPTTGGVGAATGGTSGGSSSSSGGAVLATGGTTGGQAAATGGTAGGVAGRGGSSTGGMAGASAAGTSGANSGGVSSGGVTSGGASGSAGLGGKGGAAGAAGAAGAGGGSTNPGAVLNGEGWTMKCTKADPSGGDRCYLLPPNQTTCPSTGYTSVDKTLQFGGTPGTIYDVTIRFQGTHEAGDYQGGTANPKQFLRGATHISGALHTWLSMEVSAPAATFNPNSGGGAGTVQVYDYTATIPIEGGATIRLKAADIDCLMHRYCQNGNLNPCKGLVVEGISPADNPIDGGFLQMTVISAVAR